MTNYNTLTGPKYGNGLDRKLPWDVMGAALTDQAHTNLDTALAETGLDFTVEMVPMTAYVKADDEPMAFAEFIDAPKAQAVVRPWMGSKAVVGVTGKRFTPIQNRDAFGVAENLVGEYGATIVGLADFRHGGASLMCLDLGRPIVLDRPDGGTDVVDLTLLAKNAHDGSSALTFGLTPFRPRCTNALQGAIAGAERVWKVSHTPNGAQRVELARQAILKAVGYQEKFAAVAQTMMDTEMVEAEFAKIVAGLFPVDAEAEGKVAERKRETQAELMNLYRTSETLEGVRGTRWGGYNALTEYLDHYRPVRGDAAVARAEGQIDGPNVRVKANVFKMFAAV